MIERVASNDETVRLGLLLESAQAQQQGAAENVDRLQALVRSLDVVVRDEIHRTLLDELKELDAEIGVAIAALHGMRRAASLRAAAWVVGIAIAGTAIPGAVAWTLLPSARQIDRLRVERAALERNVAALATRGGRIEIRHCGSRRRLCVRIDLRAPRYGKDADFAIAKGG